MSIIKNKEFYDKVERTLIAAKALIADPNNWLQGAWRGYRDTPESSSVIDTVIMHPKVTCFCSAGAFEHVIAQDYKTIIFSTQYQHDVEKFGGMLPNRDLDESCVIYDTCLEMLNQALKSIEFLHDDTSHIIEFNDLPTTTHSMVMRVYDTAIEHTRDIYNFS